VYLEGTKKLTLTATLPKDSIPFYRYRIAEEGKQNTAKYSIPNTIDSICRPGNERSSGRASVRLGRYSVENKILRLEIYKLPNYDKVNTTIYYNKPLRPAAIQYITLYKKPNDVGRFSYTRLGDNATIKLVDDVGGFMVAIGKTDVSFLYYAFLKHMASGKIIRLPNNWIYDLGLNENPFLTIDASYLQDKGDYELVIAPVLSRGPNAKRQAQESETFHFTVQKETTFTKKDLALLATAMVLLSGVVLSFIKVQSNKKLGREKREKEISQLQLNLVRSQLNPHFMFNALASIQNLMNKNDADSANRYLGRFARLTRNVLKNQEFINLAEEINLLEDYLQMEKLRFGFHYTITVDNTLEIANVEIPAMLLQPFVENAVKHGVSELQQEGRINIRFARSNTDLHLTVTDNGSGFDADATHAGLGLALSHKRIVLLNKLYKNTPILLTIKSSKSGTEVKISLVQWL
jgi:two-component sensor histidine kinase